MDQLQAGETVLDLAPEEHRLLLSAQRGAHLQGGLDMTARMAWPARTRIAGWPMSSSSRARSSRSLPIIVDGSLPTRDHLSATRIGASGAFDPPSRRRFAVSDVVVRGEVPAGIRVVGSDRLVDGALEEGVQGQAARSASKRSRSNPPGISGRDAREFRRAGIEPRHRAAGGWHS